MKGPVFSLNFAASDGKKHQGAYSDYPTRISEQIAVASVERKVIFIAIPHNQRRVHVPGCAVRYPPLRVDRRSNAIVRIQQNPPVILNRSHARHIKVLPRRAGVSIPSIVRNIDEDISPLKREWANLTRENRLIADEDSKRMPIVPKWLARFAALEVHELLR